MQRPERDDLSSFIDQHHGCIVTGMLVVVILALAFTLVVKYG